VCTEAAGCWFVVGCAPLLIGMTLKGGLTWKGLHSRAGGGGLRVLSGARHSAGSGRARWCSFLQVLLVSSSRYPDQWIVPGGGMEPEEEPGGAAVREVYEEAGVKGKLGRLLGIFENQDRKHRTYVYVLTVTEILEDWEDSVNIGKFPFPLPSGFS